nr:NADH dehydrogenase subunit 4L [Cixiidae sp.]
MFFFFFLLFMVGLLTLFMVRKHYLMSLLSLELIFLSVFLFMTLFLSNFNYEFFFCIMFLVVGVCDGVLGLSLLVYIVRKFGSDYVDSFSLC